MPKKKEETPLKQFWYWLWHGDSILSWIVSIGLAFVVIKYVVYPVLGLIMGAQFPVVAVVSDSMEHNMKFENWWAQQEDHYLRYGITSEDFKTYPMDGGFNKGDIILLIGVAEEKIKQGDIIVFWGGKAYPIIHRVIAVDYDDEEGRFFQTKGDNNLGQIINPPFLDERKVTYTKQCTSDPSGECQVILGKAVFRIPFLGWVKIWFVSLLQVIGLNVA